MFLGLTGFDDGQSPKHLLQWKYVTGSKPLWFLSKRTGRCFLLLLYCGGGVLRHDATDIFLLKIILSSRKGQDICVDALGIQALDMPIAERLKVLVEYADVKRRVTTYNTAHLLL